MGQKAQEYLKKLKEKEWQKYQEEKVQNLLDWEICEKVYSPDDVESESFPFSEWSDTEGRLKYFNYDYSAVSDQEYEEIKKLRCRKSKEQPTIVFVLYVIAFSAIILGLINAFGAGKMNEEEFDFMAAYLVFDEALFFSIMMFGFGKVIELLADIKNAVEKQNNR